MHFTVQSPCAPLLLFNAPTCNALMLSGVRCKASAILRFMFCMDAPQHNKHMSRHVEHEHASPTTHAPYELPSARLAMYTTVHVCKRRPACT